MKKNLWWLYILLSFVVGVILMAVIWLLYTQGIQSYFGIAGTAPEKAKVTWELAGIFGDSFGGFNAFFSGLAFLGVVVSIMLQCVQFRRQSDIAALQTLNELRAFYIGQMEKNWKTLTSSAPARCITSTSAIVEICGSAFGADCEVAFPESECS